MPGPSSPRRTPPFERRRARLVDALRKKGIDDERVLEAVGQVPRHAFMEPALQPRAYEDEALPIGRGQTISQPFTVAYQTMMLAPQAGDRVLEVGTGSGYQAAVLCELGVRVFTVERHGVLLRRTRALLRRLDYRVTAKVGDGTHGWRAYAPYDGILVTAGARDVPAPLLQQLRTPEPTAGGGRLVIPVGDAENQQMLRITRTGAEHYEEERLRSFRFVPLVGKGGGGHRE